MANDRWYNPGDHYILDDLSGFKVRYTQARKIPGGQTGNLLVDWKRWEDQQPQDFVRGVVDDQTVEEARPRQKNQFIWTATYVTALTARGGTVIYVDSIEGFQNGNPVQVMLDSGEAYITTIIGLAAGQMMLLNPLPASVGSSLGDPIENQVLCLAGATQSGSGLFNNNGVLGVASSAGWPLSNATLGVGGVWSNSGVASVVQGAAGAGAPVYFGFITAAELLARGAADLTMVTGPAVGSGQIWSPLGLGELWVA